MTHGSGNQRPPGLAGNGGLAFSTAVSGLEAKQGFLQEIGTNGVVLAVFIDGLGRATEDAGAALDAVFLHAGVGARRWLKVQIRNQTGEASGRAPAGNQRAAQAESAKTGDEGRMALGPVAAQIDHGESLIENRSHGAATGFLNGLDQEAAHAAVEFLSLVASVKPFRGRPTLEPVG